MVEFKKVVQKTRLLDPRCGYVPVEVTSEVRFDPLTGETGRVAHFLPTWPPPAGQDAGRVFIQGGSCPFCPENVERLTPKFPENVVPGGRLRKGEAVVFPAFPLMRSLTW